MAQTVKNLPVMWKIWVQSLGWEDLLEKEMATHSSILAWRIPWTEESEELTLINELRSVAPTYSLQESGDLSPSTCSP